jgi:dihydrolipoamide dehydrogenase
MKSKTTPDFPRPLTTVDVAILCLREDKLHVLLVKRPSGAGEPYPGRWALPGGFVDIERDRDLESCAMRKLRDKTGIAAPYLEQVGSWGNAKRDPRGWSATHVYFALIPPTNEPPAAESQWHEIEDEGVAVAEIMAGQAGHVNYEAIPSVVYTWPELASVGATEEELKERGVKFRSGTFPFMANGRAKAMDETEGVVKVLSDATTDRVVGVHIVGPRASDMIAEAVAFMEFGASAEDIARTCHAHPTLSEIVKEAALAVAERQIHL